MRIVWTDNFDGRVVGEKFVEPLPRLTADQAARLASLLNSFVPDGYPYYWRSVPDDYKLKPKGFAS